METENFNVFANIAGKSLPGRLYGMSVIATKAGVIMTGGFDKPFWGLDEKINPWVNYYNKYRVKQSIHELNCPSLTGCKWTKWNWGLTQARGNHVSFIVENSNC